MGKKWARQDSSLSTLWEPATKRIQALLQFGYNSPLVWRAVVNLAVIGSIPIETHFSVWIISW
jgi:hypothetical protein